MLINWMKVSPESISDLDPADIFNSECLLQGEKGITLVMDNEQNEASMKCT